MDAGRTGAQAQDVRLLLWHCQGQGLTSANSYVKCRLKSDAESANMRVAHIFAHGEKSAKRLKTKGIPQTQRFAGFHFFVRWLQFGYFALIVCDTINYFISHLCNKYFLLYISKKAAICKSRTDNICPITLHYLILYNGVKYLHFNYTIRRE